MTPSGQIISSQHFDVNGDSTGWYSYNYDIRQSTTAIVDNAGVQQNTYEYDAFGNTVESETTTELMDDGTSYVFTGDIEAMWLRDSSAQVQHYLHLAKQDHDDEKIYL